MSHADPCPLNGFDPVRFELLREGEIIALGCSFPFPHDAIIVTQTDRTVEVDTLDDARAVVGADTLRLVDRDAVAEPVVTVTDELPDPADD